MTLCPIAIVVGCKKCPAFTVCPLKSLIGDYTKDADKHSKHKDHQGTDSEKQAK